MLNDIFYHGSKHSSLVQLDVAFSLEANPFGPAIYLTKDRSVADCYVRNNGAVYCVRLSGDMEYIINLDERVELQSDKAIDAIRRLSRIHYKNTDIFRKKARDIIHPDCEYRALANSFLKNRGIWLIYGNLGIYEDSGLMDKGTQYAVINNAHVIITSS
jgi:hypothetical protein